MSDLFSQLPQLLERGDAPAALATLAEHFLEQRDYHRLFEIRKLQARRAAGLPWLPPNHASALPPEMQRAVDQALLAACREVATLFLSEHNLAAAWPYLEPLEDRQWVREQIERVLVNDENRDSVLELTFHRGGHPVFGFREALKTLGTCNAITMFDSSAPYFDQDTRRELVTELISHFYQELLEALSQSQISESSNTPKWTAERFHHHWRSPSARYLGGPHLDATHLHSVTRIGQLARDPEVLQKLWDLCQYGLSLPEMFHFPGQPPFSKHFADLAVYYGTQLGLEAAPSADFFREHLEAARGTPAQLLVWETVVDWLTRLQHPELALEVALDYPGDEFGSLDIAPRLLHLCGLSPANSRRLESYYRQRQDILGWLLARLSSVTD